MPLGFAERTAERNAPPIVFQRLHGRIDWPRADRALIVDCDPPRGARPRYRGIVIRGARRARAARDRNRRRQDDHPYYPINAATPGDAMRRTLLFGSTDRGQCLSPMKFNPSYQPPHLRLQPPQNTQ
jgi:hypothetical protein